MEGLQGKLYQLRQGGRYGRTVGCYLSRKEVLEHLQDFGKEFTVLYPNGLDASADFPGVL